MGVCERVCRAEWMQDGLPDEIRRSVWRMRRCEVARGRGGMTGIARASGSER